MKKIIKLAPDVILAPWSGLTQEQFDALNAIAPTVAYPDQAWSVNWDEQIEIIGKALGQEDEAAGLISDLEASSPTPPRRTPSTPTTRSPTSTPPPTPSRLPAR